MNEERANVDRAGHGTNMTSGTVRVCDGDQDRTCLEAACSHDEQGGGSSYDKGRAGGH